MDLFKNIFSLGIGAAYATKEQIEKNVDALVKRGEINKEEAKELIRQWVEKGGEAKDQLDETIKNKVNQALKGLDLASRQEVRDLERRIDILERKNQSIES